MKIKTAIILVVVAVSVMLAGCVTSSGTKINESQLSAFVVGKSTVTEVVTALGRPNDRTLLANGERLLAYSYLSINVLYGTGIKNVAAFHFNADGILIDKTLRENEF